MSASKSEFEFEFEVEGRIVRPGQIMYVHPHYHWSAGDKGKVERYYGDKVMLRHVSGAVPTVPVMALSWEPHPMTTAMQEMEDAGVRRPTPRDVRIWLLSRETAAKAAAVVAGSDASSQTSTERSDERV